MQEKPKVVVSSVRTRRTEAETRDFSFREEDLPTSGALQAYRQDAWRDFKRISLPTTREEAWRRTDLRLMPLETFSPAGKTFPAPVTEIPVSLLKPMAGDLQAGQISISPDQSNAYLADEWKKQGVIFKSFRTAEKEDPELVARLAGDIVRGQEGKFAALAAALAQDGVVLYVPKGISITQPLHSIFWGSGENRAVFSHVLVWLDEGASVTYVHESASSDGQNGFHAGLVEIKVSAGANFKFVELQSWGDGVWNFSHERAQLESDASMEWIFGSIGSRLTKNFSSLDLVGKGSTGRMSGFYFSNGSQHLDHDTQQNHLAEHTTSDLLFKGALKGNSRSVWQGMIYVAPSAQKTDGYQANRNLVLSPKARADSIPGLEILADDVRCTHGATVGKIDSEPMFYLLSRGIPETEAERLIVDGFFDPIMQRIPYEGVRERFQRAIVEKMSGD